MDDITRSTGSEEGDGGADNLTEEQIVARTEALLAAEFGEPEHPDVGPEHTSTGLSGSVEADEEGDEPAPFPKGLKYNDSGNSDRLVHLHRDRIRFIPQWNQWAVWNKLKWVRNSSDVYVVELAKDVSQRMFAELADSTISDASDEARTKRMTWATRSADGPRLSQMVKLARGMEGIVTDPTAFDTDLSAFGVGNGWIDLRDGSFHPPDPSKLMTMHSEVNWNPDAEAPTWDKALTQWLPDPEVRDYFQRLVGEAASGLVREHMFVLIYGDGGNGKGTAIGVLSKVFGPYYVVPHKSLLMTQQKEQHETVKAALQFTRLAVAAETRKGARLNEAQVKELTGGDQLWARKMNKDPWPFTPAYTLWLQTNELPEVEDAGEGVWRRVRVMEWPNSFLADDADTKLPEKLAEELEGVLKWIVAGSVEWYNNKLREPKAILDAIGRYRQSQDLIAQFLEAKGVRTGDEYEIRASVITEQWVKWTGQMSGTSRHGRELKRGLEAHGYEHIKSRPPKWKGLTLSDEHLMGG